MCQNRDRSYRNAGRGPYALLHPTIRQAERERERRVGRSHVHPLETSNLFHFKVPAFIGTREKVTTNVRRICTVTYRMEKWHVWGGLRASPFCQLQ